MNYLLNILAPHSNVEFLSLLALATVKATVLIAFVALINLTFRRISAATRHLLWTFALCAALLLPFLSFLTFWEMAILPIAQTENAAISNELNESGELLKVPETPLPGELTALNALRDSAVRQKSKLQAETNFPENFAPTKLTAETFEQHKSPKTRAASPALLSQSVNWTLAVWIAGTVLLLIRLFAGLAASGFLARGGREFKSAALNELFSALCTDLKLQNKTRLRRGERTIMPVVCGVFRSVVLLPAGAEEWSEQRQRMVLLHELAHVARRDCLTQMLAQTACAFYWFNPLIWIAARRQRVEREQACDDRVLSIGTKPSEYAHHLLEIARSMQEERSIFEWSQTTSVAMARRSQLEGRLLAILREENKFGAASRAATAGLIALMCFLLVSLAVVRPTTIKAQKSPISETISNDRQHETALSVTDSLRLIVAEQRERAAHQKAETDKAVKKPADSDVLVKPSDQAVTVEQIDKNDEPNITPALKDNSQPNNSETVGRQILTIIQMPEISAPPAPETSPFINAGYRQETKPQTQEKSGDFIDEMASVGLTNLSVNELIMLKTHRVTADFIRGLRALGFNNLTAKTITNLRIYRVTPAYIEAMAALGYKGLTLKELTSARIYSVTPEYAKAIQSAGYPSLSLGEMIKFKIYGITPEIVRSARSRLGDLTPKQLVSLKIAGVLTEVKDKKKETE
jgi:beta-lactamase regulating signal transducer with metallopeptidase domain